MWWAVKQVFADSVNIRLTVKDLAWFLIRPMDPYWYLWVLFFYYLIFYYIGKRGFRNKWVWAAIIAASLAGSAFRIHWEAFRKLLLYMFPFYLGMYLSKQDSVRKLGKWVWITCGMISMAALPFIIFTGKDVNTMRVIGIVSGVSISLFIILMAVIIPICIGIILKTTGLYLFFFKLGALYKRDMG